MVENFYLRSSCPAARLAGTGIAGFMVSVYLLSSSLATAANVSWTLAAGHSADWSTSGDWSSLAPPKSADTAYIINGGTANVTLAGEVCSYLYLGDPNSANSGAVHMTGGGLTTSNNEYVGNEGAGTFSQSGGANTCGALYIGNNPTASGSYALTSSGYLSVLNNESVGSDGTGTITQSGGTNTCNSLLLGFTGGSGTYGVSGGYLQVAGNENLGYAGTGTFTQSGGTHSVGDYLYLGFELGASGSYSLSGNGYLSLLNNNYEYLGYSGTGTFMQSGGSNSCGYLTLGNQAGSAGTYTLSGSGYLSVANNVNVGYYGTGTFTQSGGTHNVAGWLYVGYQGSGTYGLSGGSLQVAGNENLGYAGTGTFTQSGGTHNVGQQLYVGYEGSGAYSLSGSGYLSVNATFSSGGNTYYGEEYLGSYGTGTFTQSGGTNSSPFLSVGGGGGSPAGSGTYSLSGNGYLSVNQANGITQENVGDAGTGLFLQTGGTNSCGFLYVGNQAGSSGAYNLSGSGYLTASGTYSTYYSEEDVGSSGKGTFTQSGGTNSCPFLSIGHFAGSSGTYSLSGNGYLSVNQANGNTQENVGDSGTGLFLQTGGTVSCGDLALGNGSSGIGSYSLTGGYLAVANNENVGWLGTGTFTQSGGINTIGGALNLGANTGSSGTYNLNGGLLVLSSLSPNQSPGLAAFYFGGGTLQASGPFSTALAITLGTSGGATFDTAGYAVTLAGPLSGSGGLTKVDSGTLTLAASNSYGGGTTINGGILQVASAGALGNGGLAINAGLLDLNSFSIGVLSLGGTAGAISDLSNSGAGTTTLSVNQSATTTFGGAIQDGPQKLLALNKSGTGTLVLAGSSTYSGGTTINGGILQAGNSSALGASTAALTVNVGTLDLHGYGLNVGPLNGAGTIDNLSGSGSLTVGNGGASSTFAGTIQNTVGVLSLVKTGSGTLFLTGPNSYAGSTTVAGGTLGLSNPGLSAAAAVSIAAGADLNLGFSGIDVVGSLSLNGVPQDLGSYHAGNYPAYFSGSGALRVLEAPWTWIVSSPYFGDWNTAGNWLGGIVPNGIGRIATFDNSVASPTAAIANVPVTLGVLNIASSSRIDLAGVDQGTLTMQADGGTAQINLSGGTLDKLNLPLSFNSPTAISVAPGSTLEIGNPVNLNGQAVTISGGGSLQFDVNFSASGGTLQATAGTMAIGAEATVSPVLLDIAGNAQLSGSGTIQGANVTYESSAASSFAGSIVGARNSLVLNASGGELILSGSDSFGGGTYVDAGMLIVNNSAALLDGSSLTVGAGAASIFDASATLAALTAPQEAVAVPEPGTLALSSVAGLVAAAAAWRKRRNQGNR